MAVEEYKIVEPPTEKGLGELLRSAPLSGVEIPLTVQKNIENDELAERRGDTPGEEKVVFLPEIISLGRPTMLMGEAAIRGEVLASRIEAEGSEGDDSNTLKLIVVSF